MRVGGEGEWGWGGETTVLEQLKNAKRKTKITTQNIFKNKKTDQWFSGAGVGGEEKGWLQRKWKNSLGWGSWFTSWL